MRRQSLCMALVGVACVALAAGCGRDTAPKATQPVPVPAAVPVDDEDGTRPLPPRGAPRGDARLAAANLGFGLRLFKELAAEQPKGNVFISPTSIALALAMAYNGAAGETRTAMAQALGLQGLSIEEVNQGCGALTMALQEPKSGAELAIANSLWVDTHTPLEPAFVDVTRKWYGAPATALNLWDPNSARTINDWVSAKTKGAIPEIVSPQELQQLAVALLSAVYFKARWQLPFEPPATKDGRFTLLDGTRKKMPMMSQTLDYAYLKTDSFQAVALPYDEDRDGKERFRMIVFLPDEKSSLAALIGSLSGENWEAWMRQFAVRSVDLKLPRFTVTSDFDLKPPLAALGPGLIFDQAHADFGGMVVGGAWIAQAKHKTYVIVDEKGTEAAATTFLGAASKGDGGDKKRAVLFVVDRPFLCAIEDAQTQAIVFMGAIVDPK